MDTVSSATGRRLPPSWVALITRLHFYVGLFVGPVLMALLVASWREWLHDDSAPDAPSEAERWGYGKRRATATSRSSASRRDDSKGMRAAASTNADANADISR